MKLEDLIRDNREFFDDREPGAGHAERFWKKLRKTRSLNSYRLLPVAATLLAGILIGILGFLLKSSNENPDFYSDLPPDLQETIYYYQSLNQAREDKIMEMDNLDRKTRENLIREVNQREELHRIVNDLKKFPADERVRNALIEYYRSRTEFLDYIIRQVKDLGYTASI